MHAKKLSLMLIIPLMGLILQACTQDAADTAATPAVSNDTAVHTAEVAAADVG